MAVTPVFDFIVVRSPARPRAPANRPLVEVRQRGAGRLARIDVDLVVGFDAQEVASRDGRVRGRVVGRRVLDAAIESPQWTLIEQLETKRGVELVLRNAGGQPEAMRISAALGGRCAVPVADVYAFN